MRGLRRPASSTVLCALVSIAGLTAAPAALGQAPADGFVTGAAARAWELWSQAMQAVVDRQVDKAEEAFGALLADDVSPLRLALMGDRLVQSGSGGPLLLFEQDYETAALGDSGRAVWERYQVGLEQMNQADDGFYFSVVGQFPVAAANFNALLRSDPDPVALLEFVDRVPRREEVLVLISDNPLVGGAARDFLRLIARGEEIIKSDPTRILQHIARLGGPPRQFENAVARLQESGEYAVPFMVQALRDPAQKELVPAIVRTLPLIGRPALNPLVMALAVDDPAVQKLLALSLGQISYSQAVPYLLKLRDAPGVSPSAAQAAQDAVAQIAGRVGEVGESAGQAFYLLADAYYRDAASLRADPRLDTANVWYWRDGILQNVVVPREIFNEIMAMRCCEEALRLMPDHKPSLALWLAANFRREAQLPAGSVDETRPDNYPGAVYFAQSAGPEYCLMALARAVDDRDAAVALGAIEALRNTAGSASIQREDAGRQPLAEALLFPDRLVRVRAALALGASLPQRAFHSYQNLMPVLSEAVMQHSGARGALIIDGNETSANAAAAALRSAGFTVVIDAGLISGLNRAASELHTVDVVLMASDVAEPDLRSALARLRGEFRFATLPVLIITRPADEPGVRELLRTDVSLGGVPPGAAPDAVLLELERVARASGAAMISTDLGLSLALEACDVLMQLGISRSPLFDVAAAEPALRSALAASHAELRTHAAQVLAMVCSGSAQSAIADAALSSSEPADLRAAMFAALAEAGKRCGSLLDDARVRSLITAAEGEPDLELRTAASRALGALNLPGNPASAIVRNQSGG